LAQNGRRADIATLLGILLLIAGSAGLLGLALAERTRERALGRRIEVITRASVRKVSAGHSGLGSSLLGRAHVGPRALFTFRMRRSWGVSANPFYLLVAAVVGAAAVWLLGRTVADYLPGYVIATGAAGGFFLLPRIILSWQQRRSDAQFAELLPDAVDMVVRVVRAGVPVGAAIRTVGQEANPPVGTMFAKIADQVEIGMSLGEAMAKTSEIVGNPDFRFFAVAVALQQSTGGNLAATLETLVDIIRRRRAVRLKAQAATAEVRISAIVLGSIPFCVAGALLLVAPGYLAPLFADPRGQVILGSALLGLLLAGLTIRTIMRNALRT
jgi:tight adherence protein B